ncbi:Plasmodium exported protein (hyp10), unknown function [Plasmodium sp. gorilla clade G2]|uniref:Plasmodium exported protein (hyp10), unknown function n=1 Tax=Plasmodium sp. gorilla clade G2 TaxID=880535 RepID=UPI000D2A879D|nr:Plasmodium exported protein (hyp10), unknown function [Plasmodium sp. gorilla clade G2]SOV20375.1 Plasmodium exported protein (hyp10), unknown function [Plasmodium sp. gorilla clade G2]
MSCNYFKLSLFSILFPDDQIFYNKINTVDIINATPRILLAEAQETDIFKTHTGENSLTYPTDNILEENDTGYHKTSSTSTLNYDIHEEPDSQTEQVELENENNNNSDLQKSHKNSNCKKMKKSAIIISLILYFPIPLLYLIPHYVHNKNKKKNIHEDLVSVSEKNIDAISV